MRAIEVLPDPARAAEQVGVGDAPGLDRLLERLRDVLLPDDFVEVVWSDNGGPGRCKTLQRRMVLRSRGKVNRRRLNHG